MIFLLIKSSFLKFKSNLVLNGKTIELNTQNLNINRSISQYSLTGHFAKLSILIEEKSKEFYMPLAPSFNAQAGISQGLAVSFD